MDQIAPGKKRKALHMSAFDPKRTFVSTRDISTVKSLDIGG